MHQWACCSHTLAVSTSVGAVPVPPSLLSLCLQPACSSLTALWIPSSLHTLQDLLDFFFKMHQMIHREGSIIYYTLFLNNACKDGMLYISNINIYMAIIGLESQQCIQFSSLSPLVPAHTHHLQPGLPVAPVDAPPLPSHLGR